MKPHNINDKFLELSKALENFSESDIKHLIACVHVLWLTSDENKQQEALYFMAKLASLASDEYQNKKTTENVDPKKFDLSKWEPGPNDTLQ